MASRPFLLAWGEKDPLIRPAAAYKMQIEKGSVPRVHLQAMSTQTKLPQQGELSSFQIPSQYTTSLFAMMDAAL
eukprot:scaffold7909_cov150-Skeletonema_marinoi.AAC.1